MTKRIVAGVLGTFFVVGCSSSPDVVPSERAAQESQGLTSSAAPAVQPGDPFPSPDGEFGDCKLVYEDGTEVSAQPHFVLRLPDTEGAPYGYSDGYSVPFPTPWLQAPDGTCNPPPNGSCVVDPNPAAFEAALETGVPGIVSHQFLVYDLLSARDGLVVGDRQWFYNGTTDYRAVTQMKRVVSSFAGTAGVLPHAIPCVYVLQQASDGTLVYSGYHAQVGETHDPINWPDVHP
jgi:hypothetical protein